MVTCSSSFSPHHLINSRDFPFKCLKDFSFLHSCKSIKELKQIHALIVKTSPSIEIQQLLYSKMLPLCACFTPFTDLSYIHSLFAQLSDPDINLYNTVIRCFSGSKNKETCIVVLLFYLELMKNGLVADSYTYPFVLRACAQLNALSEGEMIHAHLVKTGFFLDLYVVNTLMRLYGACGVVDGVRKVFDGSPERDLVSWTTLIQGYVDNGHWREGIDMFFDMCESGQRADEKMMVVVISACAKLGDFSLGKKLHEYVVHNNVNFDVFVGNALVDMYLKCGDAESACRVFKEMPATNVVSWNSLISGLAQKGDFDGAMNLFREMQVNSIKPDATTLIAVLNSCANLGVLDLGKWVHSYLDRSQIKADGFLGNALVDMYAKCGSIVDALGVFERMEHRDVFTYTSVILGLALHGEGEVALKLFTKMLEVGIHPNEVTFVGVLAACTHAGLVEEGQKYFTDMSKVHKIEPQTEHYGCMVDLFGRAGLLSEAMDFIENMPLEPDAFIWATLLGACRLHEKLEFAESIMEHLARIEPEKDGGYVLMSNMYASANKWSKALQLRKAMKKRKLKKTPGCSCIELDGIVYEFRSGDTAHPKTEGRYAVLNKISFQLYDAIY
ncbi:pentatricopeptide repeat-containing protein At1g08070, chloroplastic [Coffea arabica]|uniref:Pentatricopeptide repeat-containing protein At1g08070, chloroplastic-like n=1 Tax=Coffea arabica TaxID=13443 RepID=A0A6P6WE01_COFAR|nr:pentatricopeptide repeat-containing protein At1g08070, chloroplastic-like [Coffea arabica]XP_027113540.1 pentatricopeptide repeat-containing protein At1g08070, chloroplastic-like [Coffea arabica]